MNKKKVILPFLFWKEDMTISFNLTVCMMFVICYNTFER